MPALLTADDIEGIGSDALRSRNPQRYATELVDAVESERLADPEDAGYALSIAAEIDERLGHHDRALDLSARAVAASAQTVDATWVRASHAERLLRLGREDEGMAELQILRPRLHKEPGGIVVVDALTENGRGELAEQWLTAALVTAFERADQVAPDSDEAWDAETIVEDLLARRRRVRQALGLAPDEYDTLADEIDAAPDLVFWPSAAFAELLAARPEMRDELGADWDAHRADIEAELQADDAEGFDLDVEVATPALLRAYLADDDGDRAAPEPGPRLAWPPGRNDPCWCGSGSKYKKCCLPRARDRETAPEPPPPPEPTPEPEPEPSGTERVLRRGAGRRTSAR